MFKQTFWYLFALILAFSFITKLVRLSTPENFYFDEVYHAFTAQRYLHNDHDAYDVYATPPEGVAFEWTHPPLAKLIMAGFMAVLGESSFAWRLSSVVFGTAAIALLMLLSIQLFKSKPLALFVGALAVLEGLLFVQARIAMNDAHFLAFMLLTFYGYWRWRRAFSWKWVIVTGLALGAAAGSKWTAVYVLPILGITEITRLIRSRKFPSLTLTGMWLSVLGLAIATYFASYSHFFMLGYRFKDFIDLQKQMWWYHSQLVATHPYQSKPWQWVLDLRPVWMYVDYQGETMVANIYNLGNPVLFYLGLLGVMLALWSLFEKFREEVFFLLIAYFLLWLPWTFSPRIMFFYHYAPALPFLLLLLVWSIRDSFRPKIARAIAGGVFGLALLWFVVFYPHLTALPVLKSFADSVYFALPTWR